MRSVVGFVVAERAPVAAPDIVIEVVPLFNSLLTFASHGLLAFSWLKMVVFTLVVTHITIISVTIYLHRHQAHRSLELHPVASHFFRFWLWTTTGMLTGQWIAIHRKHHAKCETEEDPHSPQTHGILKVLLEGAELYRAVEERRDHSAIQPWGS
jgi:stearoyl-CoA desaturase (delta-9 desaturase)